MKARFEIDRVARGDVRLFRVIETESSGEKREWCQTFATLRGAKAAAKALEAAERKARFEAFCKALDASDKRASAEDRAAATARRQAARKAEEDY